MKSGLARYLKAAFNARPLGMFVAPNWLGLVAFALLGVVSPGFWVLGAGLELAYLFMMVQSARFRAHTDAMALSSEQGKEQARVDDVLKTLGREARERFMRLSSRCQAVLDAQPPERAGLDVQADELGRLLWVYLKLLRARQTLDGLLREAKQSDQDQRSLARRAEERKRELAGARTDEHRRSLEAQIEILQQRSERQGDAQARVAQVDAELERIEQQVELIREETALSGGSDALSRRIDTVSSSLTETVKWVREQEGLSGDMDDLIDEAPPILRARR